MWVFPVMESNLLNSENVLMREILMYDKEEWKENFYDQTLVKVKEALGEEGFQSAFDEGNKWSLEEAVKKVLGDE